MESQEIFSLLENLLPGIHNDITLAHIVTKLPWTYFHVLSSVSRIWQRAIQSREVHRERIRCQSTETLVVVLHRDINPYHGDHGNWISLYSMLKRAFYRLPPIPQFESGISRYSQFISVNGKLYVVGPEIRSDIYYTNFPLHEGLQTYVFDLAGQRQWQSCTSFPEPERGYEFEIGCGFIRSGRHFLRGGSADWFKSFLYVRDRFEDDRRVEERDWRRVAEPSQMRFEVDVRYRQLHFTVQGKNYSMSTGRDDKTQKIHVHNLATKSSTLQHSISCHEMGIEFAGELRPSRSPLNVHPFFLLPMNNELFALARWTKLVDHCSNIHHHGCRHFYCGYCVLQSKGFGTDSKDIVWEKAPHSERLSLDAVSSFVICPIQL